MKFPDYQANEITDSRGVPTVAFKANVNGEEIVSKVPSGTSAGSHEAKPLPVKDALAQAKSLKSLVVGSEFATLTEFDQALMQKDGTPNKANLGANTILGLSMLYCRLAAKEKGQELYQWLAENYRQIYKHTLPGKHEVIPMMVMVEGGVHAESGPFIQETLLVAKVEQGKAVWQKLDKNGYAMGMEGGFDIPYHNREEADHQALTDLQTAIKSAQAAGAMAIDVAANEVPPEHRYDVKGILGLINEFQLESVEDPFTEDDFDNWSLLVREVRGHRFGTAIVGDDLTVTNARRLDEALEKRALSGVIVKPNQVGSISETLNFVAKAKENNCLIIVSHRSGETDDTFIADLAVAVQADYLKAGAPSKPERVVKYERLSEIQNKTSDYGASQSTD